MLAGISLCSEKIGDKVEIPYRHASMPLRDCDKVERKVRYNL
jgi:hypothetical protein